MTVNKGNWFVVGPIVSPKTVALPTVANGKLQLALAVTRLGKGFFGPKSASLILLSSLWGSNMCGNVRSPYLTLALFPRVNQLILSGRFVHPDPLEFLEKAAVSEVARTPHSMFVCLITQLPFSRLSRLSYRGHSGCSP